MTINRNSDYDNNGKNNNDNNTVNNKNTSRMYIQSPSNKYYIYTN